MILGHHGGELTLVQAVLASAGSVPLMLLVFRAELVRLARRLRHLTGFRAGREVSPAPDREKDTSRDPRVRKSLAR